MKKVKIFALLAFLVSAMALAGCVRKPMDPCEGIRCEDGMHCVDGRCVPIRRK